MKEAFCFVHFIFHMYEAK